MAADRCENWKWSNCFASEYHHSHYHDAIRIRAGEVEMKSGRDRAVTGAREGAMLFGGQ